MVPTEGLPPWAGRARREVAMPFRQSHAASQARRLGLMCACVHGCGVLVSAWSQCRDPPCPWVSQPCHRPLGDTHPHTKADAGVSWLPFLPLQSVHPWATLGQSTGVGAAAAAGSHPASPALGPHPGSPQVPAPPAPAAPELGIPGLRPGDSCPHAGTVPGAGQREGLASTPLPHAAHARHETPGPYRPPGEADLSLVPRPSVGTLQKGGAIFQVSRDQPQRWPPTHHPPPCLKGAAVVLSGHPRPLSSRAVTGACSGSACRFTLHTSVHCGELWAYSPGVLGSQALPAQKTRGTVRWPQVTPTRQRPRGSDNTRRGGHGSREHALDWGFCSRGAWMRPTVAGPPPPDLRAGRVLWAWRSKVPRPTPKQPREPSGPLQDCPPRPPNPGPAPPQTLPEPVWGWGTWGTVPSTHS